MMCGGKMEARPCGPEQIALVNKCKAEIEAEAKANFTVFEPVSYKSQVVNGCNYFIKIKVDGDKYIHATVWQKPMQQSGMPEPKVTQVEVGKTLEDAL